MKKEQSIILVVFFGLVLILAISFYMYFYGGGGFTGDTKKVSIIETESVAETLAVPSGLEITAFIGQDNQEEFEIVNYNRASVSVSCIFPPFQEGVPSSNCYSFDSDGNFVSGERGIRLNAGERQTFFASVRPFDGIRVDSIGDSDRLINAQEGLYNRELEIRSWRGDNRTSVSVIAIPVQIEVVR